MIVITIPIDLHSDLMWRCKFESAEYMMLKNGVLVREGAVERIDIPCNPEEAGRFLQFAEHASPGASRRMLINSDHTN